MEIIFKNQCNMPSEIIKDYGKTVSSDTYINTLQGHQYIPQADQCILNIIQKKAEQNKSKNFSVLDVGCGPARLTYKVAHLPIQNNSLFDISVTGIDFSTSFIEEEKEVALDATKVFNTKHGYGTRHVSFICADFGTGIDNWYKNGYVHEFPKNQNVVFMQGVMHHIHGNNRSVWLKKCHELLKPDGILIIGDEFIRNYEDEEQRKIFVAQFYCHVIHEALKGGFTELAKEEAKNLIDDAFSGTNYAGLATDETIKHIFSYCGLINQMFYTDGILRSEGYNQTQNLLRGIRESINNMTNDDPQKNFNRGDLKISIPKFIPEVTKHGFVLTERYEIGPVQQLGGMGVLVFRKY